MGKIKLYTIGSERKSAEEFFEPLKRNGIKQLIDTRLKNTKHIVGISKKGHLPYFLQEICGADYLHLPELAPLQRIYS